MRHSPQRSVGRGLKLDEQLAPSVSRISAKLDGFRRVEGIARTSFSRSHSKLFKS